MNMVRALERLAITPMSAIELGEALGVDQRTARRCLRRLTAEGYTRRQTTSGSRRRYELTHRLAAVGRQAIAGDRLSRLAAPWLSALAAGTGHPATLWIPCLSDVVCILRAEPDGPPPQPTLGELEPAHASAPGKALLAHRDAWADSLFIGPLVRHTERTLTDPRALNADLKRTRNRGYATDHGERHPEVHAIAATVHDAGEPGAALAIAVRAHDHATTDTDTLAGHVTRTANAITNTLADHEV